MHVGEFVEGLRGHCYCLSEGNAVSMDLVGNVIDITALNVHAQTEDKNDNTKNKFHDKLQHM
jgi:hypothetical protein